MSKSLRPVAPASRTLNSDALFEWAKSLTTRKQYQSIDNSDDGAGSQYVEIANACLVEEESAVRLTLAASALNAAVNLLAWEQETENQRSPAGVSGGPPTSPTPIRPNQLADLPN